MGSLPSGAQLHILISDVLVGKGRPAAEFWLCKTPNSGKTTGKTTVKTTGKTTDKTGKSCAVADTLLSSVQTAARPISTTHSARAAA